MAASQPASRATRPDDLEPRGFDIRLPSAQLADLIQINCLNRVCGAFRVASGANEGHLFFAGGELKHAASGRLTGLDAVVAMLGWRGGCVEPCESPWPPEETIGMGADALLLSAAQRIDEQERHRAGVERAGGAGSGEATTRVVRRVTPPGACVAPAADGAGGAGPSLRAATPRDGLSRLAVARVSEDGHLQGPANASSDLADTAFFCHQLGCRIGEGLGLGPLRALSAEAGCGSGGEGLVIFHARSIVAARGRGEDLLPLLATLGLG